jgi:hypothetical protein
METVHKLESTLDGWLKPLPHLPTLWRKWLAANVWWLTMIFVVLSVFGVLALVGSLFTALSIFGFTTTFYGYYVPQAYGSWWIVTSVVSLGFLVATVMAAGAAVNPLREKKKRGWELLFLAYVISFASSLVSVVLNFNTFTFMPALFGTVLSAAISAYFLFEVREYFGRKKATKK